MLRNRRTGCGLPGGRVADAMASICARSKRLSCWPGTALAAQQPAADVGVERRPLDAEPLGGLGRRDPRA